MKPAQSFDGGLRKKRKKEKETEDEYSSENKIRVIFSPK